MLKENAETATLLLFLDSLFPKSFIERKIEGTGKEEEDLRSYWMTLRKIDDIRN
jgi:hypothetical protein